MNDMLDLQLEPDEKAPDGQRMPPLRKPTIRTSGRLKIVSVKKYLFQRLGLRDSPSSVSSIVLFEYVPPLHFFYLPFITLLFAATPPMIPNRLKYFVMVIRSEMSSA